MSTVMQPRGPLPARVYWVRRLLALVALVLLVAVVWWLVPNGGASGPAAARQAGGTARPPTGAAHASGGGAKSHAPSAGSGSAHAGGSGPGSSGTGSGGADPGAGSTPPAGTTTPKQHDGAAPPAQTTPPADLQPTGPCDPTKLTLAVRPAAQAVEGRGARIGLVLSTSDGTACALGITPSHLDIAVTLHGSTVWESTNCPDELPVRNVVVEPSPTVVYAFRWDGHVDTHGCRTGWKPADPGVYQVDAAFIGGEPATAYLPVVPEPSPGQGR